MPKARRRYRQFSLRTFLVVLTIACVWFGWHVNRANRQRHAVEWVLDMRGVYDYEVDDDGHYIDADKPTIPEWLRDFYDQVEYVTLSGAPVYDVTPLADLNSLRVLQLNWTPVHDVTPLEKLKSLHELYIVGAHISDEQITKLQQTLPNCFIKR